MIKNPFKKHTTGNSSGINGTRNDQKHAISRKRFRLSDFLAERVIKGVAFMSITIIILIFVFVFREAFPIFHSQKKEAVKTTEVTKNEQASGELKPESYGSTEELKPETYGTPAEELKPESYGPPVEELKPETYGEPVEELNKPASTESNTTAEAKPEQYGVDTSKDSTVANYTDESTEETVAEAPKPPVDENRQALKTLNTQTWQPVSDDPRYGLWPLIIGTLKVTLISILFAAPLAILAALYTSVFANKKIREFIKPAIELLAGIPSVVIGFFALMILASFLQNLFGYDTRLNSFVGGIAMALAAIPIIYTIAEDALTSVPKTYYEASLALGASKWQTAFFVILPAATPGIFAAILLGIGRVFGETMIALMATGNAAMMGINPFESVRTLSATIGAEMAEVVFGDTHYSVLFLIGALLFVFTFSLNAIAEFYVKGKLMKRIQGK
jgi:phosphate transport system permease protein